MGREDPDLDELMELGPHPDALGDMYEAPPEPIWERIGRGASTEEVIAATPSVIEGIPTTKAVLELARRYEVEMPIVSAVASVLFEGVGPQDAIEALMTRQLRSE